MTASTTPPKRWALHYRPMPRRRRKPGNWNLHAVFPDRESAELVAREITAKFRHLNVRVVEAEQVTEPTRSRAT